MSSDTLEYWYGITPKDLKAMSDKGQWLANPQAKKIRELQDRIKRLEEAGDAIVDHNIGCGCGQDGPCRACRMACEAWNKAKEAKP